MPETHSAVPTPAARLHDCVSWTLRLTCSGCHRVSALDCGDLARTLGGGVALLLLRLPARCD